MFLIFKILLIDLKQFNEVLSIHILADTKIKTKNKY